MDDNLQKKLKIIPENPYLLRLVIHDRKYLWSVLKKKGAGGELVSRVSKKWFTLERARSTDQNCQMFGGGVHVLLMPQSMVP